MIEKFNAFIEDLANTKVTPNVYNQYSYGSKENSVRRNNLFIYLKQMYELKPNIILLAEAPGYRGSRVTGVPFTSEHLLMNNMEGLELFGKKNGYRLPIENDKLLKEATATIIWDSLIKCNIMALGWNAFPFHPHKKSNEMSNRTPLKKELLMGQNHLLQILEIFEIRKIIAVGNKAEESLRLLGFNYQKVRHPAQGGKNQFMEGIKSIRVDINK